MRWNHEWRGGKVASFVLAIMAISLIGLVGCCGGILAIGSLFSGPAIRHPGIEAQGAAKQKKLNSLPWIEAVQPEMLLEIATKNRLGCERLVDENGVSGWTCRGKKDAICMTISCAGKGRVESVTCTATRLIDIESGQVQAEGEFVTWGLGLMRDVLESCDVQQGRDPASDIEWLERNFNSPALRESGDFMIEIRRPSEWKLVMSIHPIEFPPEVAGN